MVLLECNKKRADLSNELESHIQMQIDDNLRTGMPAEMARRGAVLKFGSTESVKETYRDQRGLPLLETFFFACGTRDAG
jgi:macrolide transport system ATP-binding/permease protein